MPTPRSLLPLLLAACLLLGLGPAPTAAAASGAPSGLKAVAVTATTVRLSWTSSAAGAHYRVKYSSDPGWDHSSYVVVATNGAVVTGLASHTRYWFKVRRVTAQDASLTGYSGKVRATTSKSAAAAGLRVGSYNVRCSNCSSDRPYERPWSARVGAVAAAIRSRDLDVVGIQEASQGWLKDANGKKYDLSQFEDLRDHLGGSWRLTNAKRNNCVRSSSPSKCVAKDQGASQGTKIVYNSERVDLLDQGSKLLPSGTGSNRRYLAWAIMRQRSTGKKFFVADTQLEHGSGAVALRTAEAKALAAEVAKRNPGHLPTLVVGDMNSDKHEDPSNTVYDVLVGKYHYVDPLGNTYGSKDKSTTKKKVGTVEKRVNTWLNSYNDFAKVAPGKRSRLNGSYIDYIFTTKMRVTEWETVADVDSKGTFRTPPPSDHNLIRATVLLP